MPSSINKPFLFWLSLLAVIVIIFGVAHLRHQIFSPFEGPRPIGQIEEADIIGFYKNLDTDKDGLSDYEEIYTYGTSAFLADSDGDGYSDKEEIEAGSNPLNPQSTPLNVGLAGESPILEEEVKKEIPLLSEVTAAEIRELLVTRGGLSRELVENILDEDLIKLYNETKKETGISLEELSKQTVKSENLSETERMLQEMDPKILRELLLSQGVDQKMLEQIDDAILKKLFLESLGSVGQ